MAYIAKYLLSITEFMDKEKGEALMERASLCVDEERRRKAGRLGAPAGRAPCLGAGLLLQLAVEDALRGGEGYGTGSLAGAGETEACCGLAGEGVASCCGLDGGRDAGCWGRQMVNAVAPGGRGIKAYAVTELLECRKDAPVRPFVYRYGEQGKPYFANLPYFFSLSHSGSYVLCGLSMEEVGADIQQHCRKDVGKLARRFFTERETAALEQAGEGSGKLFYRLWARKEAYGKLTGKGIGAALGVELLPGPGLASEDGLSGAHSCGGREAGPGMLSCSGQEAGPGIPGLSFLPEGVRLDWEEWGNIDGYSIAFCRYG